MINNINNKLAFCFMFYFIACTFAESDSEKCYSQMKKANLLMVTCHSVMVVPSWQRIIDEALVPICNHINRDEKMEDNKGDKGEVKSEGQEDKNLFKDISLTCESLTTYQNSTTKNNKAFQPILNNIFSTCSVLNNYLDYQGSKYKRLDDLSPICKFLLEYHQKGVTKYHSECLYTVDDFFPICTFVMNHHKKNKEKREDNPQDPKQFCDAFIKGE